MEALLQVISRVFPAVAIVHCKVSLCCSRGGLESSTAAAGNAIVNAITVTIPIAITIAI